MKGNSCSATSVRSRLSLLFLVLGIGLLFSSTAMGFTVSLNVEGMPKKLADGSQPANGPIPNYRWLIEEDTTHPVTPGTSDPNSLAFSFHKAHAPVVAAGTQANAANITLPDGKRYFVSILPNEGYTIGGAPIAGGGAVTIVCNELPLPTAQITVFVFEDNNPINNAPDAAELGLAGFKVVVTEAGGRYGMSGGQQMTDAFGNMIGTTYEQNPDGTYVLDAEGNPAVVTPGQGFALTDANGNATIKFLSPGKYGIVVAPPVGQGWQQTSTIEGTKTSDAWVKPDEPPFFTEFGPAGQHVFFGFVKEINDSTVLTGGSTISGQAVNLHMSRPPAIAFFPGEPHANAWVGLNVGQAGTGPGIYAAPCDPETGEFSIPNVPAGTYQLVFWDKYLDNIFGFLGLTVPPGGAPIALGEVAVFRWFGRMDNKVFYDANENGIRDADEMFVFPEQAINLRFRDGSMYQSLPTDNSGNAPLEEVFPFFNWLVAEVDFLRFKATGLTVTVDGGGGPLTPGSNINPQVQAGGALSRTETGPVLTQGMQLFIGQTNSFEWGKKEYGPTENGGISGIVYYANTRAENDPRFGVGDPWEPGIPRVQVSLYADGGAAGSALTPMPDGVIDDLNGDGQVTLADVDNYPFNWRLEFQFLADGVAPNPVWTGAPGTEDVDRNGNGVFDAGDAIAVATSDSWDDNLPTDCPGDPADPFYNNGKCYDGLRNFNQVRPGVFDGGYAFSAYVPGGVDTGAAEVTLPQGTYIVEAAVPLASGYLLVKEEDRNVDFGDSYTPSLQLLPPVCVGEPHTVPAQLSLFPGVDAFYAGQTRPLCDRKQVVLNNGQNTAADFHFFTEVPRAGRIVGFILNDLGNEFDPNAPSFGEKFAPPWLPVSIRDYRGTEINRVYSDEFGAYNALVPSTFSANRPIPSGFAPNMLTVVINDPFLADGQDDLRYNSFYSTFQYTFQYMPGVTTYLDTPVLPIAAFASPGQFPVDAEFPDGTPVVGRVDGAANGPYVAAAGNPITITSLGTAVQVRNPNFTAGQPQFITRDYGFGVQGAGSSVSIDGTPAPIVSWNANTIVVNAPNSGQLVVTRDNGGVPGKSSVVGIYVTVGGPVPIRVPTNFPTIQAAIDNAGTVGGSLIIVEPGTYNELVILHKDVQLQGTGAGVTNIQAFKVPADKLQTWRTDIATRLAGQFDLLDGQTLGLDTFKNEFGPGIIVLGENDGTFDTARIDGFRITGADQGGAILVNGYTDNLLISNNRIRGNEGFYGGGIRVGHPELIFQDVGLEQVYVDAQNNNLTIQHNHISQNGGLNGAGGGISIHTGANNYTIRRNFIAGNFTSGDGAGIGHLGDSAGTISGNTILFNQSFNQGLTVSGGGMLIAGLAALGTPIGPGSGAVIVDNNRIQGNLAGAGDGGGIALRSTNADLITITDNVIVNNVTGLAGGGIALQDAANVNISNNTIAMNDSTATASLAFPNGIVAPSVNQPAGIVSRAHTPALNTFLAIVNGFSNPNPFAGNIIWQNRTFTWDPTITPPALVPVSPAALYWDLGVLGAAGPMNPAGGTLTSLGPSALDPAVYAGSNAITDPGLAGAYFNGARGIPGVGEVTVIQTAIAADEGGNAIDVAFGRLTYTGAYTDAVAWGPNGGIGVLATTGASSSGGSGGGWACFIAAASDKESPVSGSQGFAVFGLGLLAAAVFISRKFKRDPSPGSMILFILLASVLVSGLVVSQAGAEVIVQCPADTDGIDTDGDGIVDNDNVCKHLAAGDGFINMADGKLQYIFGFSDVTGVPVADVMSTGMFGANFPAPTLKVKEGQKLYLSLTNVGMMARPDLFDPHTVHYHGFPNASAVFDGVPDASISINMGASLTYFYYNAEPGTFIYHCHVEAAEHMQMGMLGQLYVTPRQDGTAFPDPDGSGRTYTKFAYNDGDGSTGYDVDFPIQIASFDPAFHDASLAVQPLPFALMQDKFPMLNGRGYPDTINPAQLPNTADMEGYMMMDPLTRKTSSLITCTQGQKVLLRVSSLSTTSFHTLSALGIPMKVVGKGARILRGPTGKNLFYNTSSVDLGGGEAADVILDTKEVPAGTYFLYVTNLNHLSNDTEDYGGMMTEIVVNAAQ